MKEAGLGRGLDKGGNLAKQRGDDLSRLLPAQVSLIWQDPYAIHTPVSTAVTRDPKAGN